jgi:hypothetical protein
MFVKKQDVDEVRERIRRYHEFRELSVQLAEAYIGQARQEGFARTAAERQR